MTFSARTTVGKAWLRRIRMPYLRTQTNPSSAWNVAPHSLCKAQCDLRSERALKIPYSASPHHIPE